MLFRSKQQYLTTDPQSQILAYASSFSHENEVAEPGYYAVFLDTYQVKAEISATKRGAIHRYTFPESTESGFIIDLDYSLQRQTNSEMKIEIIINHPWNDRTFHHMLRVRTIDWYLSSQRAE